METLLKYKDALTAIQLASQDPFFIGEDPQGALDYISNLAKEVLDPKPIAKVEMQKLKVIVGKPISPPPVTFNEFDGVMDLNLEDDWLENE